MNEIVNIPDEELMKQIADGTYNDEVVDMLTEKNKSVNQMKLFLLAQAKKELSRVIKLTAFLDKIEESYQTRVMEEIDMISLKEFPTIISTITSCLARSNSIVQKVLMDDSLTQLVIIDNSVNKTIGTSNSLNLDSPDARDRVNKIVRNVMNIIDTYEDNAEGVDQ